MHPTYRIVSQRAGLELSRVLSSTAVASFLMLLVLLALPASGCGGRTGIALSDDIASADGGVDDASAGDADVGFMDADLADMGPPDLGVLPGTVSCRTASLEVPLNAPVLLVAIHGDGLEGTEGAWRLARAPGPELPPLQPAEGREVSFIPARVGQYRAVYELTDVSGETQSCTLNLEVLPVPPVVTCPEGDVPGEGFVVLRGAPLALVGSATDDDEVSTLSWSVTSMPMGARTVIVETQPGRAQFTSTAAGEHELTLIATDSDGLSSQCRVTVRVSAPPTLDCPTGPVPAVSQSPVDLAVTVTDDRQVVGQAWTLLSQPPLADVRPTPSQGNRTRILPPRQGDYQLRFTATDDDGLVSSCDILVRAVNAPPQVMCPMATRGIVDTAIPLAGDATDDEGVQRVEWSVQSSPAGAITSFSGPGDLMTSFRSNVGGIHVLQLQAFDADGASASCTVEVDVRTPPVVTCPESPVAAQTRSPVSLMASAVDDGMLVRTDWTLLSVPPMSSVGQGPFAGLAVEFTPDRVGDYLLEFRAVDDDGLESACQVRVEAAPSAPMLECPTSLNVRPLRTATVEATLVASDAPLTDILWTRVQYPDGSTAAAPSPAAQLTTQLLPDVVGPYLLRLDVEDGNGFTAGCDVEVRAVSDEGLRVEMFWDSTADMDVHVMDPAGTQWFSALDCHYANCRNSLPWGGPLAEDNPRLDIDDVNGFGPENINIEVPVPGVYRVAVDAYRGGGNVSIRIYCGGSVSVPVAELGPTNLGGTGWMWRVADVEIRGPGDCSVTTLEAPTLRRLEDAGR